MILAESPAALDIDDTWEMIGFNVASRSPLADIVRCGAWEVLKDRTTQSRCRPPGVAYHFAYRVGVGGHYAATLRVSVCLGLDLSFLGCYVSCGLGTRNELLRSEAPCFVVNG